MSTYTRECTVDMLSIPVEVDVTFEIDTYNEIQITKIIGPRGDDIYDRLCGPVAMSNPYVVQYTNGSLYWYGDTEVDKIHEEILYAVAAGDYDYYDDYYDYTF